MSVFPAYVPEDFDEFWNAAVEEVRAVPLDFHRSLKNEFHWPGFSIERIEFRSVGGGLVHGWLAVPHGAKRMPGFVWVPPYGRESLLPNEYGTREGMISLSLNLHGLDAFHQEKYTPNRGYFAEGAGDPLHWIFRRLFQHAFMAVRVLQAQIEVDEDRIGAMGMSQGGGISIWLGAHCPIVRAVVADMPFLGAMTESLTRNVYRYPLKELVDFMEIQPMGRERVLHTLSYYDTVNQATRCRVPTLVSRGLKDPSVRPETAEAIFQALVGRKKLVTYDWGHDWHRDMIETNREWLMEHLP